MGWLKRHAALAAVLAVIAFAAAIRLRVADVPLERDEGEYAYAGQLILQGVPPYTLAYNMKFPGTYYAYAGILAVFGQSAWGIHVGLLVLNACTTLVLFLLARRALGSASGAAVSAAAFALLSLDRWTNGVFAHATHFVLLPALGGVLVLVRALESRRQAAFLIAGVWLGTAVLMKQHAAAYVLLALALLLVHDRRHARARADTARRGLWLAAGVASPFAVLGAVLAAQGALGRFWFWTIQYASEYVSLAPLSSAWPLLRDAATYVPEATGPIWLLAGAGLAALWLVRWPSWPRVFVTALAAASVLAILPGFIFRPHYFILILPAAGCLCGVAFVSAERVLALAMPRAIAQGLAIAGAIAVGVGYVAGERHYLFAMNGVELSRALYAANPFPEAVEIGRYLEAHTAPDQRIAVLGSEPEIYVYARRTSATGYIYTYPLTEAQAYAPRMREEMMQEVESARPLYLVLVWVGSSWITDPRGDRAIMDWAGRYSRACYDVVGIADIEATRTTMVWDIDARDYHPHADNVVYTLRRKNDAPCVVPR